MQNRCGITVERPSENKIRALNIKRWPIWKKEKSEFNWKYEERETCYVLEGEVAVITSEGIVTFGVGDLVTFPKGMECVWQIKKPVLKHYHFG